MTEENKKWVCAFTLQLHIPMFVDNSLNSIKPLTFYFLNECGTAAIILLCHPTLDPVAEIATHFSSVKLDYIDCVRYLE